MVLDKSAIGGGLLKGMQGDLDKQPLKVNIDVADKQRELNAMLAAIDKSGKTFNALFARHNKNGLIGDFDKDFASIQRMKDELSGLERSLSNFDKIRELFIGITSEVDRLDESVKLAIKSTQNLNQQQAQDKGLAKLENQIIDYVDRYSKVANDEGSMGKIQKLLGDMASGDMTLSRAQAQWAQLTNEFKKAGLEADTTGQKFLKMLSAHASSVLMVAAINELRKKVYELYENVVRLDAAMTDLQIASGLKASEVQALAAQYSELGKQIGISTEELLRSADSWSRQGYDTSQIEGLIQNSAVLSKIGQVSADEATKYLTSAMKGFNVAAEDSIRIVDKLSTVDMQAAVSAGGLAEAMARTAASAQLAGIDMDRLIGYLATVGEVTQREMSTVGEAFKTLFARMGNIKAGRLVDPETEEDLSDVEATLRSLGITLRDTGDNFRDFGDVFDEIGGKWDSFSDVQQRAIAVALGGTRMQENFLVLMQNYGNALEYADISLNSTGQAMEKFGVYQDSVAGKSESLKAATEGLSMSLINSDLVKWFLDIGIAATSGADGMVQFAGVIPSILTAISTIASISGKSMGALTPFSVQKGQMAFNGDSIKELIENMRHVKSLIEEYSEVVKKSEDIQNAWNKSVSEINPSLAKYFTSLKGGTASLQGYGTALVGATVKTALLKAATIALNAVLVMGASMIVSGLVQYFTDLAQAQEKAQQAAVELTEGFASQSKTLKSNIETVESLEDEFKTLAKGVDSFGNNVALSADEYDRYRQIVSQILDISPQLITGYDEEGNAIAKKNGLIEESIKLLKEEQRIRLAEVTSEDNIVNLGTGYADKIKEFQKGKLNQVTGSYVADDNIKELRWEIRRVLSEVDNGENEFRNLLEDKLGIENLNTYHEDRFRYIFGRYYDEIAEYILQRDEELTQFFTEGQLASFDKYIQENARNLALFEQQMDTMSKALNPTLQRVPETLTVYDELSDAQKAFISQYINGLRITADTTEDELKVMRDGILSFTDILGENKNALDLVDALFDIDASSMTAKEYLDLVAGLIDQIAEELDLDEDFVLRLKVGFDVASEENGDSTGIGDMLEAIAEQYGTSAESIELDIEDLRIAYRLLGEEGIETYEDLLAAIERFKLENSELSSLHLFGEAIGNLKDQTSQTATEATSLYERLHVLNQEFAEGNLYVADYIDGLRREVDAGWFAGEGEEELMLQQALFASLSQAAAETLGELLNGFQDGTYAIGDYQEGLMKMSDLMTSLGDTLATNAEAWGLDLEIEQMGILSDTIANARSQIELFADSNMALHQILSGSVDSTAAEYEWLVNTIASDLATIVENSGEMSDAIASQLGTSSSEIAQALLNDTSNMNLAASAMSANTNSAIGDMINGIADMLTTLGDAISKFEFEISVTGINKGNTDLLSAIFGDGSFDYSIKVSGGGENTVFAAVGNALKAQAQKLRDGIAGSLISVEDYFKPIQNGSKAYRDFSNAARDAAKATGGAADAQKALNEELKKQKELLKEQEDSINNLIDLVVKMIKQEQKLAKEALQDQLDARKKIYEATKKAMQAELDAYKKKIDAQKESLRLQEKERNYQKELTKKQKAVSDIEAQLIAIRYDDSEAAQKKRLELEEQLSKYREELAEYQHDRGIELQEDALDKEYERFKEIHDKKIEALEKEYEAFEEQQRLKIKAIEDYLAKEGQLRQDAIALIETRSDELYQRLLNWNRLYGDGVDATITGAWNSAYDALIRFNGGQIDVLNTLAQITQQMAELEARANAAAQAASNAKAAASGGGGGSYGGGSFTQTSKWKIVENMGGRVLADGFASQAAAQKYLEENMPATHVNRFHIHKYAKGSKYISAAQLAQVDEEGREIIVRKNGGRLVNLETGDGVIPHNITERLLQLGANPANFLANALGKTGSVLQSGFALHTKGDSPIAIDARIVVQGNVEESMLPKLEKLMKQQEKAMFKQMLSIVKH